MKTPHILVIGDVMLDQYLWGKCSRISPEAPVQIVDIEHQSAGLGGAGNVASNLVALGARVTLLAVVGDDQAGCDITSLLAAGGIDARIETEPGRTTTTKTRLLASGHQIVRYDHENRTAIGAEIESRLLQSALALFDDCDMVLLSDYAKGVLTPGLTQPIIAAANHRKLRVLVDPKGEDFAKYAHAHLITPNRTEAGIAARMPVASRADLENALGTLKRTLHLRYALATLSEEGIALYDDALNIIPAVARDVFDVTGAGDTVLAALGYAMAQDHPIEDCLRFANLAAGVVIGKIGGATASLAEIEQYAASVSPLAAENCIKTREEIGLIVRQLKAQGKKIVFTNGCFDLLHRGHVACLEAAKQCGDILIVGMNDDDSVRRLKGDLRPIVPAQDRAYMLGAMRAVDYVVVFTEDTPYQLIQALAPDVLVKGSDYAAEDVVGADLAGEVRIVPFVEHCSTTALIQRLAQGKNS